MGKEDYKEPFVPQEARQRTEITADTPLSELRVRDLITLIGAPGTLLPGAKQVPEKYFKAESFLKEHYHKLELGLELEFPFKYYLRPDPVVDLLGQLIQEFSQLRAEVTKRQSGGGG